MPWLLTKSRMHFGQIQTTRYPCGRGSEAASTPESPRARLLPASTEQKKSRGALRGVEESHRPPSRSTEEAEACTRAVPDGRHRPELEAIGAIPCINAPEIQAKLHSQLENQDHPAFARVQDRPKSSRAKSTRESSPLESTEANRVFNSYLFGGHLISVSKRLGRIESVKSGRGSRAGVLRCG